MMYGFMLENSFEEKEELMKAGCEFIFESAESDGVKEFEKCIELYSGTTLVISKFSSISPTICMSHIAHILQKLGTTNLVVLELEEKQGDDPIGYLEIAKHLGDLELSSIRKRTSNGLDEARKRGTELGRPKIDPNVVKRIQYLYRAKRKTVREIADDCNVSVGTAHKYINQKVTS